MILFQENKVEVRRRLKDGRIDYLESVYKLQHDVLQYVTPGDHKNQVAGGGG